MNLLTDMGVQPVTPQLNLIVPSPISDKLAPFSEMVSLSSDGDFYIAEGFAQDKGGGKVSGIEVSTDSGHRWHRATSLNLMTGHWSYGFSQHAAIDDIIVLT